MNQEDLLVSMRMENDFLRSALDKTGCGSTLLRQRAEFSLMLEVSTLIVAELDIEKVLQLVADKARDIVRADQVLVPMLNDERTRYTYVAASGADADKARGVTFNAGVGMCGWVLKNERSLLFGEGSSFWMDEKTVWEQGQQSAVLVPLFGRKRIIGGLSALGKQGGGSFSAHDLDLLTVFANHVSIAIENALLFRQVTGQMEEGRRKEQCIQESEKRFRKLLASVTSYLYTVTVENGRPVATSHSPECAEVTGFTPEDFAADADLWYRMIFEDDRHAVLDATRRVLSGVAAVTVEHRIRHKQGQIRWVRSTLVPHFGPTSELLSYDGVITDITRQKQAEQEIRKLNEELEERVKKRTAELVRRNHELEQMNKVFVSRELRMVELKDKIKELEKVASEDAGRAK